MKTQSEGILETIHNNVFLREFSFARNEFSPAPGVEREFADSVALAGTHLIAIQCKQREGAGAGQKATSKWFSRKVRGKAVSQLADTVRFFQELDGIRIQNGRGHVLDLQDLGAKTVIPVVVHSVPGHLLMPQLRSVKHFLSDRIGFVHVFDVGEYGNVCKTLYSPVEVRDYLLFRRDWLLRTPDARLPEWKLVAQFICEEVEEMSDEDASLRVLSAMEDVASHDLGPVLERLHEGIRFGEGETQDYYHILRVLSQQPRSILRGIKERVVKVCNSAMADEFDMPRRFRSVDGKVGFVMIPLESAAFDFRLKAIQNIALAAKHDWKLDTIVGVSAIRDGDMIELDWFYAEHPHGPWPEMDEALDESYPFRGPGVEELVYRYRGWDDVFEE